VSTSRDHLGQVLTIAQAERSDVDDELETLEEGADVAKDASAEALCKVTVGPDGVLARVEAQEEFPEEKTGVCGNQAHCGSELSMGL
jgi:hypothetical protein